MNNWNQLHYNALAKEIRELFPLDKAVVLGSIQAEAAYYRSNMEQRAILTTLALNLTKRFKEDNELFDPVRFLDACSPNTDSYPLSELWEDET